MATNAEGILQYAVDQLVIERDELLAQANRTAGIYEKEIDMLRAENERLRARLCYVNPDGSHVRGCAQHEAMHPAQWCEALARANCG